MVRAEPMALRLFRKNPVRPIFGQRENERVATLCTRLVIRFIPDGEVAGGLGGWPCRPRGARCVALGGVPGNGRAGETGREPTRMITRTQWDKLQAFRPIFEGSGEELKGHGRRWNPTRAAA
jgi:hypothetical protein